MKKISILFTAVVSVMAVSAAVAAPPKNLSWKTMQEVTFNFNPVKADPKQQAVAKSIWGKKIHQQDTAFVLLGQVETADSSYTLSSLSSSRMDSEGLCEPPPNGDGTSYAQPLHSSCPLKVVGKIRKPAKFRLETSVNFVI